MENRMREVAENIVGTLRANWSYDDIEIIVEEMLYIVNRDKKDYDRELEDR